MAVTKLSKLTLIAPENHQERLLKKLQSLQMRLKMSLKMQKINHGSKNFLLIINKRQRLATQRRFAGSKKQSCSSGDKAEAAKYESGNANLYNCLHLKTPFKSKLS